MLLANQESAGLLIGKANFTACFEPLPHNGGNSLRENGSNLKYAAVQHL